MKLNGWQKIAGGSAVTFVLLASLMVPLATPVEAHMIDTAPPPEFKLEPIVISDGGVEIEIAIDDVGSYHVERMKEYEAMLLEKEGKTDEEIAKIIEEEFAGDTGTSPATSFAFRVALLGISEVWGDEIPERNDIKIITRRPTPGATQCLQYITGTGTEVPDVTDKGELEMILADGTEVTDLSVPSLNEHAKDAGLETWSAIIIRKSTGEQFEVQVREDVIPEGFDELRVKVEVEETATLGETSKFRAMWAEVRDAFLTQPDWVLFEGLMGRFLVGGAIFLGVFIIGITTAIFLMMRGRKKRR
jgi:hypothetical protein